MSDKDSWANHDDYWHKRQEQEDIAMGNAYLLLKEAFNFNSNL